MPQPLAEFNADDWQEWLLEGPDPAAEAFKDGDSTAFYAGIADRPELVAHWGRLDAHKRWYEARRAWLTEHVDAQAGFDFWIDAVAEHHRMGTRDHPAARGRRPRGWAEVSGGSYPSTRLGAFPDPGQRRLTRPAPTERTAERETVIA
jgi:hypothetical protein